MNRVDTTMDSDTTPASGDAVTVAAPGEAGQPAEPVEESRPELPDQAAGAQDADAPAPDDGTDVAAVEAEAEDPEELSDSAVNALAALREVAAVSDDPDAMPLEVPVVSVAVEDAGHWSLAAAAAAEELKAGLAGLTERFEQSTQKVEELTGKVALLSAAVSGMTTDIAGLSEETGQVVSWTENTRVVSVASKIFLSLSLLVLLLLLGGMSYLAIQLMQTQHRQNAADKAVSGVLKLEQKRLSDYDKHFADLVGAEIKKERASSSQAIVQDKLNRLRNGLAEQRLYRKNNGDWFVEANKREEVVTDPELIELLNQAFAKAGRALTTTYLVPPHKAVSVLRPNGHGGTDIVVTKDVVP